MKSLDGSVDEPNYIIEQTTLEFEPNNYKDINDSDIAEYSNSVDEIVLLSNEKLLDEKEIIYDLVAEIDDERKKDKKQLAEDEFINVVDDLKNDLYKDPNTNTKIEDEEEQINQVENKLRNLNKKDQVKVMEENKKLYNEIDCE